MSIESASTAPRALCGSEYLEFTVPKLLDVGVKIIDLEGCFAIDAACRRFLKNRIRRTTPMTERAASRADRVAAKPTTAVLLRAGADS